MVIHEMTREECQAVLARASMGRLGCALDNQPYVVPVYFAYEPDYIYVLSTFGQKIKWMRANPRVCIEIEEAPTQPEWVTVLANGSYQELAEPQYSTERAHARKLLEKRHRWWLNALAERRAKSNDDWIEPLFFRIKIDSVTGLRAGAEGEPPR